MLRVACYFGLIQVEGKHVNNMDISYRIYKVREQWL